MVILDYAEEALKNYYLAAMKAQLSTEGSPFYNAIEKSSENIYGKEARCIVTTGDMSGIVAVEEDGDLPPSRINSYRSLNIPLKNIYGTIEISDKAIRASSDSSGSFVNLLNAEMEGLVASAKANFARMLYGDGNGTLCKVVSKNADKILEVSTAKGFFKGLKVSINFSPAMETIIIAVDAANNLITLKDSITATVNGKETVRVAGASNNELTGLAAIFDSASIYGYYKTTESFVKPVIKHCSASKLSEEDLIDMIDLLEEDADAKTNMILCSHKTRKQIAALMTTTRRIVNTSDISAGYTSIIVNDVPVYADKYCPDNRIYFINTKDFMLSQLCDWEWLEDDGGRILRQIPGKAAFSATLVKYAELVCKRPCGQGAIYLDAD